MGISTKHNIAVTILPPDVRSGTQRKKSSQSRMAGDAPNAEFSAHVVLQ